MRENIQLASQVSIHAPTWGATNTVFINIAVTQSFNPRAHVGRDEGIDAIESKVGVSIHAPTWGATAYSVNV